MEIKDIKGMDGYFVSDDGRVFRELSFFESKRGYKTLKIKSKHCLIHRLVATQFVDNPDEKPEVNHIDGDKHNNHKSNLEWVTRAENMNHSYDTLGYTKKRNAVPCYLVKGEGVLGEFETVKDACKYASEKYGLSYESLSKNRSLKGFLIIKKV